jgi:hypothetical protein
VQALFIVVVVAVAMVGGGKSDARRCTLPQRLMLLLQSLFLWRSAVAICTLRKLATNERFGPGWWLYVRHYFRDTVPGVPNNWYGRDGVVLLFERVFTVHVSIRPLQPWFAILIWNLTHTHTHTHRH